jgi:hypothetical protein
LSFSGLSFGALFKGENMERKKERFDNSGNGRGGVK